METIFEGIIASWQFKLICGMVAIDLALGVASALRRKVFTFTKLADFYQTNVIPYILGYVVLYVAITKVMPPDQSIISQSLLHIAWGALVSSLAASIYANGRELYNFAPPVVP